MKRTALLIGVFATLGLAGSAIAGDRYNNDYRWARVLSAQPIVDVVREPVQRQQCYDQRYDNRGRDRSGATMLGAVIGGVIGHKIDHNNRRSYRGNHSGGATIAGALIGGAIGNQSARNRDYYRDDYNRYGNRQGSDCRVYTDYARSERIVGYDVRYKIDGRVYHTRTDYHPGRRIRVDSGYGYDSYRD